MGPAAKRRKTSASAVEEVHWDPSARQEYLTGFHKRKQQRIQHSQKIAAEKERAQRIADRKQIREQRKQDLERHVQQVNNALYEANKSLEEDDRDAFHSGTASTRNEIDDPEAVIAAPNHDPSREDEYIDEDKYTTVTVEPMAASEIPAEKDIVNSKHGQGQSHNEELGMARRGVREKKKPPKFRYETKADRRDGRMREQVRKTKAAYARRTRA